MVTNAAQQVVWRHDQAEPFGNNPPDENPSGLGVFEQPLRDAGTYFDKETNLLYNWHRYRDPSIGRFPQADPLGLYGGDLSPYVLRRNNPLSLTDPRGMQAIPMPPRLPPPGKSAGTRGGRASGSTGNAEIDRALGGSGSGGAANDSEYDDKDCPPDCKAWRDVLNQMYHTLDRAKSMVGFDPIRLTQMQWIFNMNVKAYEQQCGPYDPPPSMDDIYTRGK